MLKKTITFKDLDGNDVTEEFYFSLSKAELAEMELGKQGGMQQHLLKIIKDSNGAEIIKAFKEIIYQSVGQRSEDGRRFIKSTGISDAFMQTDAYSVLFMELVTDAQAGATFVNAVMPSDLVEKAQLRSQTELQLPQQAQDLPVLTPEKLASLNPPTREKAFHELTPQEISGLDREQLLRYLNKE
jgi:hypothetical protein